MSICWDVELENELNMRWPVLIDIKGGLRSRSAVSPMSVSPVCSVGKNINGANLKFLRHAYGRWSNIFFKKLLDIKMHT